MKKATATKTQPPPSLGTKRVCPKCATKFYDFDKNELTCPKCKTEFSVEQLNSMPRPKEVKRRTEKVAADEPLAQSEEVVTEGSSEFESVEDLGDDEDVTDDLEVEEENDENY